MSYAMMGLGQADGAVDLTSWRRDLALANEAQIPVAALRSIRSVESGANPAAIRFEPHLFWRTRKGLDPSTATGARIRAAMTTADMAAVPYTPGNTSWRIANSLTPCRIDRSASCTGSETNRAAFERAFAIDPAVAVRSTSWGSYQVLGSHLLGLYSSPSEAVRAFDADPRTVGERLLASWMRANPRAQAAARAMDWAELARRYNGCSDCSTYVTRLREAYSRWGPEWESVRAAVEAAGVLAVSTVSRNPLTSALVGVTVLGGGAAFAWWAYKRSMKRNRRRRHLAATA